jgi:type IV pilus assembly protein PilE
MRIVRIRRGDGIRNPRRAGFTLLEILIAMVVVAILLALAIASYQRYVVRAQRAEAVRILLGAAGCQERQRAQTGYYDTSRCASGLDTRHYAFRIEPDGETEALEFRVFAEPRRRSPADRCGSLSLDQAGTRTISGPGSLADCWGGR